MFRLTIIALCPIICLSEVAITPGYKTTVKAEIPRSERIEMPTYMSLQEGPGSTHRMSWKITKFPTVLDYDRDSDPKKVIAAANWAFNLWSSVANLDFYQTYSDRSDFELSFELPVEHDKNCPNGAFDHMTSSKVVAAHYVLGSKNPTVLHFNDEIHWSTSEVVWKQFPQRVAPLKLVFAHEIGHALGLAHTNVTDSIMNESFNLNSSTVLSKADMAAIMMRYGIRIAPKPTVSTPVGNCPSTVMKVAKNSSGQSYAVCAVLYDRTGCDGDSLALGVGYLSLTEFRRNNGRKWADTVSSMEINPNCSIDLCIYDKLNNCRKYRGNQVGKNIGKIDFAYDNNVLSVYCSCGIESEFPSDNITVKNNFTTNLAETTNFGCPNVIESQWKSAVSGQIYNVCAIAYDKNHCGGDALRFSPGLFKLSDYSMISNVGMHWENKISSLQVSLGCSMKLCTLPGLTGNCGIFGANGSMLTVASMVSRYDNNVESGLCYC